MEKNIKMQKDYFTSGYAIDNYYTLETELLRILETIPLYYYDTPSKRKEVISPKLADLLLRIGSNVDIFFKHLLIDKMKLTNKIIKRHNQNNPKFQITTGKIKNWNMGKYILTEPELKLNNEYVQLIFYDKLYPFKNWTIHTMPWWTAYNKIKHDAFLKMDRANLEYVLNALGGFFTLICRFNHLSHRMVYYGYLNIDNKFVLNVLLKNIRESQHTRYTKLFIYPKPT